MLPTVNATAIDAETSPYRIALPQFEGPFDLLLFFIERDEIDIANIPIAKITDDFLRYIREAKALDISLAGDFIVVAATLTSIKARVLLPRLDRDESGQEIDPRQELVDRLLEYQRYCSVIEELRHLETARGERFARPFVGSAMESLLCDARVESEWESVTLYRLLKTFERVLERHRDSAARPVHRVARWPYTVEGERERVLRNLRLRGSLGFAYLFERCADRVHAVVTFLALLELLNAGAIGIEQQVDDFNAFVVTEREPRSGQLPSATQAPNQVAIQESSTAVVVG